jgi:hypothetical protein
VPLVLPILTQPSLVVVERLGLMAQELQVERVIRAAVQVVQAVVVVRAVERREAHPPET